MPKSPDAFRTISEVAEWLGVQAHVLRFWESKFSQVKPVKRAGGRRYYRPADMLLLGGIRKLLHDDGLTIKGVQKILREQGMAYVSDLSMPLDDETMDAIDALTSRMPDAQFADPPPPLPEPLAGEVVEFRPVTKPEPPVAEPEQEAAEARTPEPQVEPPTAAPPPATPDEAADMQEPEPAPEAPVAAPDEATEVQEAEQEQEPEVEAPAAAPPPVTPDEAVDMQEADAETDETAQPEAEEPVQNLDSVENTESTPEAVAEDTPAHAAEDVTEPAQDEHPVAAATDTSPEPETTPEDTTSDEAPLEETEPNSVPSFLSASRMTPKTPADTTQNDPPAPKPRVIDAPDPAPEDQIAVQPGTLAALARIKRIAPDQRQALRPLLAQLTALRDQMVSGHEPRSKE